MKYVKESKTNKVLNDLLLFFIFKYNKKKLLTIILHIAATVMASKATSVLWVIND